MALEKQKEIQNNVLEDLLKKVGDCTRLKHFYNMITRACPHCGGLGHNVRLEDKNMLQNYCAPASLPKRTKKKREKD